MITITDAAAKQVLISAPAGDAESALRLAVRRLADGSFDYAMGWDTPDGSDSHATSGGVRVIVAPSSTELLRGATLDYVELTPGQHRFIFHNPNDPAYIAPRRGE